MLQHSFMVALLRHKLPRFHRVSRRESSTAPEAKVFWSAVRAKQKDNWTDGDPSWLKANSQVGHDLEPKWMHFGVDHQPMFRLLAFVSFLFSSSSTVSTMCFASTLTAASVHNSSMPGHHHSRTWMEMRLLCGAVRPRYECRSRCCTGLGVRALPLASACDFAPQARSIQQVLSRVASRPDCAASLTVHKLLAKASLLHSRGQIAVHRDGRGTKQ